MTSIPSLLDLLITGLLGSILVWFSIDEATSDPNSRCIFRFKISKHLRALFYAQCFMAGVFLLFSVYMHFAVINNWLLPKFSEMISTSKAAYELRSFLVFGLVLKIFNTKVEEH